jgi:hypothetical protein
MWLLQSLCGVGQGVHARHQALQDAERCGDVERRDEQRVSGSWGTSRDGREHRCAVARPAIVSRGSIGRGERARVAEELGQLMDDRVDAIADLADELGVGVVVEVTQQVSCECGVVEEFLEEGSVDRDVTCVRRHGSTSMTPNI